MLMLVRLRIVRKTVLQSFYACERYKSSTIELTINANVLLCHHPVCFDVGIETQPLLY